MKQVTLFEGTVKRIEADTTGWGETIRTVGVAVTLTVRRSDSEGNYDKETVFHLPKDITPPVVGDVVVVQVAQLGVEDLASESELAELPDIPDPGEWAPSREDDDSMTEVPDVPMHPEDGDK